jgi:hypothetical protein
MLRCRETLALGPELKQDGKTAFVHAISDISPARLKERDFLHYYLMLIGNNARVHKVESS